MRVLLGQREVSTEWKTNDYRGVWGGDGAATTELPPPCSAENTYGRHLRKKLYASAKDTDTPFRAAMNGDSDPDPSPDPDSP